MSPNQLSCVVKALDLYIFNVLAKCYQKLSFSSWSRVLVLKYVKFIYVLIADASTIRANKSYKISHKIKNVLHVRNRCRETFQNFEMENIKLRNDHLIFTIQFDVWIKENNVIYAISKAALAETSFCSSYPRPIIFIVTLLKTMNYLNMSRNNLGKIIDAQCTVQLIGVPNINVLIFFF